MELFLILLLIVLGYFAFLYWVILRASDRVALSTIALAVLMVYGCAAGAFILIVRYLGEIGIILYTIAVLYSVFYLFWKGYRIVKEKPGISWGAFWALVAYVLAILYITLIMRENGSAVTHIQMKLFNWLDKTAQIDGTSSLRHTFLNVVMFVPFGLIYPFIGKREDGKLICSISSGLLLSVMIETVQLLLQSGMCDIDDIIANTLGAAVGACMVIGLNRPKNRRWKNKGE